MLNLLKREKPKEKLPIKLSDWSLETENATIRLRIEMKIKSTEMEPVRVSGENIRSYVDITVPRKVEKVENLKNAHVIESETGDKLYLFSNREAVSSYLSAKLEGKDTCKRVLEAYEKSRYETTAKLSEVRREIALLERSIMVAEDEFRDSSDNLAYNKAKNDLSGLEGHQRKLKEKLKEPKPERPLGLALGIQFAALEIIDKHQIEDAVKTERKMILSKYRGLPDSSEIQLSRRLIATVKWN